jgi:hypothetical protein
MPWQRLIIDQFVDCFIEEGSGKENGTWKDSMKLHRVPFLRIVNEHELEAYSLRTSDCMNLHKKSQRKVPMVNRLGDQRTV